MTTINNSENLIEKVGGIEMAREIVDGAPELSTDYVFWTSKTRYINRLTKEVYLDSTHEWFSANIMVLNLMHCLDDLRTAIAEHDNTDIGTEIDSFLDAFKSPELTDDRKEELTQDWKGMSGGVAFSLIERHADNWKEIDYMMNQWLEANKEAERHG